MLHVTSSKSELRSDGFAPSHAGRRLSGGWTRETKPRLGAFFGVAFYNLPSSSGTLLMCLRGRESSPLKRKMGIQKLQTKTTEGPFRKVFIMIAVVGQMFAKNSKQKLWLFVLYLFDPKFVKMAPGTHNVATNQINRSHCADRTRW